MDRRHFEVQMARLADTFGAKNYGDERVEMYWQEMNQFPNEWMTRTINQFIKYERYPPLMEQFDLEIAKEREQNCNTQKQVNRTETADISQWICMDCRNSGILQVDENGKILDFGTGYTYRCYCERGAKRTETFPRLIRHGLRQANGQAYPITKSRS